MWELQDQINNLVEQYFEDSNAVKVSTEEIGLDIRAGTVFVSTTEGWIAAVGRNVRTLEYYGGFEYISEGDRMSIGDTTFYSNESSRVARALEHYEEQQQQEDEMFIARRQALISEDVDS